jgi:chromosome segregation protein
LRNEENLIEEIKEIKNNAQEKRNLLKKKSEQEEELNRKFKKLISQRESLQTKFRESEIEISSQQTLFHSIEQEINNFKIDKARLDAETENLETEIREFGEIELVRGDKEVLTSRLNHTQEILSKIGSVNLRSLEVYESVKKEYDAIKEKMETVEKEKEGILKIIHNIDIRKKKTFIKTLKELNDIFSRNFSRLNTKGHVSLELENRKDPFELGTGVKIMVKTGHGKYFDATSLSGGEQVLIALSLIFAIQELRPYQFYLLDEIDAALDKRNSERLSLLLKKYMEKGQYIIITHNDEVILNANNLYGLSMHEGISKVISLRV